jgi:hypothetical protein
VMQLLQHTIESAAMRGGNDDEKCRCLSVLHSKGFEEMMYDQRQEVSTLPQYSLIAHASKQATFKRKAQKNDARTTREASVHSERAHLEISK